MLKIENVTDELNGNVKGDKIKSRYRHYNTQITFIILSSSDRMHVYLCYTSKF